ncbi:ABC transporter permease [Pseudonocardia sp. GCM10023141]|uniref:ABC transporter permease n=1 Tax=Pseudonocardia sp. GCM10023141 TaxID=3252653 RepID=UPI003611A495
MTGWTSRASLTGTGALIRLGLRRDRVLLPLWIAALVAVAAGSAASVVALYPTAGALAQTATALNATPSLLALYGPLYDPTSLGALAMWKPAGSGAVIVGLLALFTVVRHTRAEEESGRQELLGATVVGRGAELTAALCIAAGTAVVLGLLTAAALLPTGLGVAGAVAFGAAWTGCGLVFAAIGGLVAQLTRSARAARGLGIAAIVVAFGLRAVGDSTGPGWLTWLSPFGWVQLVRAFQGERWWVLLLPVGLAVVLAAAAHLLDSRRDVDAGMLPDRAGPATASGLGSALALAWRLQRGVLAGWAVGFLLFGFVLGNVATGAGGLLDDPQLREIIVALGGQQALTDAFLAVDLGVMGMLAAAYAVQATLRLHGEERALRAEAVLAGPVGRIRWAAGHLVVVGAGTTALMAVAGAAAGWASGLPAGSAGHDALRLAGAALVQLPAIWVLVGVVMVLFGVIPRAVAGAWVMFGAFLLIGELGPVLRAPQWLMDLSPFTHTPRLPGPDFTATPLVWMALVALVAIAAGLSGIRHRDVG